MSSALKTALADCERSYYAAKASVGAAVETLLASGPAGLPGHRPDLMKAGEQLRAYRGWVYTSVRPIAQKIAGQAIHVGRTTSRRLGTKAAGTVKPLESHPLLDLLADPNDLMVAWSLIYTTVASLELTGRALWWLPEGKQILPIPTSWIVAFEGTTSITAFVVRPPHTGEPFRILADECCYFHYPHPGDPHGAMAPLQAVGAAVDADDAMTISQASMFRRGIHPSHAVIVGKHPDTDLRPHLNAAQQRQIIGAIKKRYADVHNHGEPLILDGLIEDVRKLSNTPAEMDWLGSGKVTKARIMQGFGTNPIIAGEIEGSNRASAHAADKHFCDWTVNPKIELLSQCLTEWLGPMFGGGIVIWIEPCVANDAEMALKWAETLAKHSAITGDELRELSPFDLKLGNFPDPVAGGGSDPALDAATATLQEAINESKAWGGLPPVNRLADHYLGITDSIVETNGKSGRHS